MEIQVATRRQQLNDMIQKAIQSSFETVLDRANLPGLDSVENLPPEKQANVRHTILMIRDAVENTVQAHVEKWVMERGLDEVFDIMDEHSVGTWATRFGEEMDVRLEQASVKKPEMEFLRARLECKKRLLEDLKRQMEEKKGRVEMAREEFGEEVGQVSVLTERNGERGRN